MRQNLSDLILANRSFLNLNELFSEEKMSVIRFYLNKDIRTFLGKESFLLFDEGIKEHTLHFSSDKDENSTRMIIEYKDEAYAFISNRWRLIIQNLNDDSKYAYITYYNDTNSYVNDIYYKNNDSVIHERQRVYLSEYMGYEYKKSVKSEYGKIKYPIYKMKLIKPEDNDNEYFEILSLKKDSDDNTIQKIIDRFTSYSLKGTSINNDEYLKSIFDIIEEKTNTRNNNKKLVKTKNIANI